MGITNFKQIDSANGIPVAPSYVNVSEVTSSTYTLQTTDAGDLIKFDNSGIVTVTVPADTTTIPVGTTITVMQWGAGRVDLAPAVGVTIFQEPGLSIENPDSVSTRAQYSRIELTKVGANQWLSDGFGLYIQEDEPLNAKDNEVWLW